MVSHSVGGPYGILSKIGIVHSVVTIKVDTTTWFSVFCLLNGCKAVADVVVVSRTRSYEALLG